MAKILLFMWLAWGPNLDLDDRAAMIQRFTGQCTRLGGHVQMAYAPPRWYTFNGDRVLWSGRDYFCVRGGKSRQQ